MDYRIALKIVDLTLSLLSSESKWNKNSTFGESCTDSSRLTLGCAIQKAQIKITGVHESRNLVMRKIRAKIRRHFLFRHGIHPITNFNRHRNTTYSDVKFILNEVKEDLIRKLGGDEYD